MGISNNTLLWVHIISLVVFIAFCICLHNYKKMKRTYKKLENSEKYNETLQTLNDDVRCFKHDFDNIVTTIGGYVTTNDMNGLKEYYNNLANDCKDINNLYLLNPKIINNPGVYNLLVDKYEKAKKLNIKMTIEFLLDLKDLHMKIYEFTRILGILLDNSIEAAKESKEKLINIYFRNEYKNKQQLVIIENSYNNKNVNLDDIFEKSKTDKKNHSGLGLFEVRKILKKNNNLNLYTTKNTNFFIQQLEIYYA